MDHFVKHRLTDTLERTVVAVLVGAWLVLDARLAVVGFLLAEVSISA